MAKNIALLDKIQSTSCFFFFQGKLCKEVFSLNLEKVLSCCTADFEQTQRDTKQIRVLTAFLKQTRCI